MDKKITAFVFAAGLGTRLYPLTASKPKALVVYQGKTLLQHVIERIIDAGITEIIVNVHHFADQIVDFLREHPFPARIRISDERAYLRDTAGGLKFAEPLFEDAEMLLLYNVDIMTTLDIRKMIETHQTTAADVTLAVRQRQTSRYLVFEQNSMRLCGWRNVTTGDVNMSSEPMSPICLAFSGIHVMNRDVVKAIPSVEKMSLTPFYLEVVNSFKINGYLHDQDEWMDVGKYNVLSNVLS